MGEYDQAAKVYDSAARETGYRAANVLAALVHPHLISGSQILEPGVGTGFLAELLAPSGVQISGMDFSAGMLAACQRKGVCHQLITADIKQPWPFASRSMNGVVVCGVMEHIKEPAHIVAEASRVLKKDGFFAMTFVPTQPRIKAPGRHKSSSIEKLLKEGGITLSAKVPFREFFAADHRNGGDTMHWAILGIKATHQTL